MKETRVCSGTMTDLGCRVFLCSTSEAWFGKYHMYGLEGRPRPDSLEFSGGIPAGFGKLTNKFSSCRQQSVVHLDSSYS